MPAFEFQALDPAGREQRGVLEADSPRQVRQLLRDRQWLPVSVLEVGERRATAAGPAIESPASAFARLRRGLREPPARIGGRDLALITRQLATLVRCRWRKPCRPSPNRPTGLRRNGSSPVYAHG